MGLNMVIYCILSPLLGCEIPEGEDCVSFISLLLIPCTGSGIELVFSNFDLHLIVLNWNCKSWLQRFMAQSRRKTQIAIKIESTRGYIRIPYWGSWSKGTERWVWWDVGCNWVGASWGWGVWTSEIRPGSVHFVMWLLGNHWRSPGLRSDVFSAMFERNHFSKLIWNENRLETGKAVQRIYYYNSGEKQ